MRRQSDHPFIYRVRGYIGEEVRHSRTYQRRVAAIDNYRECLAYYDRVTLEVAPIGRYVEATP